MSKTKTQHKIKCHAGQWKLEDEVAVSDPFNHASDSVEKYRMFSNPVGPVKHVFVHTVYVEEDDEQQTFGGECLEASVCLVYLGFHHFVGGIGHDFHFPENEENLGLLLESLEKATEVTLESEDDGRTPFARFAGTFKESMSPCKPGWSEIFKEYIAGDPVTDEELAVIGKRSPRFCRYTDRANDIDAFDLPLTRDECDSLVTLLNELCEAAGKETNWYLAHEDEEMVHVE